MTNQTKLSVIIEAQDKASRVFKEMGSQLDITSKKMGAIGRNMSMRLTAPIMGLGVVAVKSFADFDQAMTKSTAIMKVTIEQEKEMKKVARDVAKSTAFSHKQAADAYFYLASAGLGANEAMAAMPAVAEFAQAGAFDLALATDLLTDAQSALGMTIRDDAVKNMENMIKVSDVLVKANTLANATVEQFSTSLTTEAAAAMKSFGMDLEEGVAVLAAFADQGVKGQIAGSGFSRILRLLTKAANDNKKEMKALGITVYDSQGNLRNMADIVSDLEVALGGMSDEQRTASLEAIGFTARVQGIILPLLGTSDAIREYEKNLRTAGGITEEVAEKQLKSFTNQMKVVRDIVIDAAIDIGDILIPYLIKLGKKIKELTEKFKNLTPEQKELIVKVLAIVAATGPLLIVLGAMASGLGVIATVIGVVLSPAGLFIIALVAMTGFIVKAVVETKKFKELLKDLKIVGGVVFNHVKKEAEKLVGSLITIKNHLLGITQESGNTEKKISNAFYTMEINSSRAGGEIISNFDFTSRALGTTADTVEGKLSNAFRNASQNMSYDIANATEEIKVNVAELPPVFNDVGGGMEDLSDKAKEMADAFGNYGDRIKDFSRDVKDSLSDIFKKILSIQDKMDELEKDRQKELSVFREEYAQAYIDQEEKVKEAKKKIGEAETKEEKRKAEKQYNIEKGRLDEFKWVEKNYHQEIEYLKAEAAKSEYQRTLEAIGRKEMQALEEYNAAKEKIEKELQAEQEKHNTIKQLEEIALGLHKSFMEQSASATVESINTQIAKYQELANAMSRASSGREIQMSLFDIWQSRPDLQTAFPNLGTGLDDWWNQYGKYEYPGMVLGSHQKGTDYVSETGLYQLHKGEAVIPAEKNKGGNNIFNFNFEGAFIGDKERFKDEIIEHISRQTELSKLGAI